MSHLLIAATTALGACLLLLVGVLLGLLRRSSDRVADVERRLDELASDLGGAVARAEEEGRRSRLLGDISGTIDLDEVLGRALEAVTAVPGVDAALIRVEGETTPIIAAVGLADEEAARQSAAVPRGERDIRAVELNYRYAEADEAARGDTLLRGGLAIPMADEGGPLGALVVLTRTPGLRFDDQRAPPAGGDRAPHRARDRERATLSRGPAARRPRRPDGAPQPAVLPRDARA